VDDNELHSRLLQAARTYADKHDWPWLEPVQLTLTQAAPGNRIWSVRTNALAVGMNIRLHIRESDCTVVEAAFLAR